MGRRQQDFQCPTKVQWTPVARDRKFCTVRIPSALIGVTRYALVREKNKLMRCRPRETYLEQFAETVNVSATENLSRVIRASSPGTVYTNANFRRALSLGES